MRLPGHGTSAADLDRSTREDWAHAVEQEFRELREKHQRVFVVGQSLGGLLALHLASQHPDGLLGIAVLAVPLWLSPIPTRFIAALKRYPLLHRIIPRVPKLAGSDVRDPDMKAKNPSYPAFPTRAIVQLSDFMQEVRKRLPEVRVPTLVMHSIHDHTAPYESAGEIASRVSSSMVEQISLSRSFHLIAMDVDRDQVAETVASFALRLPAARAE
jgi:carboxylesterase